MEKYITFGEIRKLVAKTDAVQICTASNDGDVEDNWLHVDLVPDRYNSMNVIGFCSMDCIFNNDVDVPLKGIEFLLDDIGYPTEDD